MVFLTVRKGRANEGGGEDEEKIKMISGAFGFNFPQPSLIAY